LKRLSVLQMIVLNTYWLGMSFMWSALHPIVLPAVLLNYVPDAQKNTYLGLLTFTGSIIAILIQPVSGALSDRWRSRLGRRRPLIIWGTLHDVVFLSLMAWAGGFAWLVIGYIGLQFASNTAQAPLYGLLPDRVPKEQTGTASSFKILMDMLALVLASLLAGRLLDPVSRDPTPIILVIIGVLLTTACVTIFGVREESTVGRADPASNHRDGWRGEWSGFLDLFRIDLRHNRAFWWVIAERGLFLLGAYGVQAFLQYYLQDVLRVPDPPKQTGDLLAALTLSLLVLVLIGGWLVDRYGSKRILYVSSFLAAAGMGMMAVVRDMNGLFASGALFGAGMGLFLTANWALANKLVPSAEAGKYLGLSNLATAGAGALARLEGPAVDGLNNLWPGQWLGYTSLFAFGAVCIFLSALLLVRIKEPR
jgi:MFS family permease